MSNFSEDENIEKNKWLLERQLAWISNGDLKIGAIVTLNLAMLASLSSYFKNKDPALFLDILYFITVLAIIISVYFCKAGFKPKFEPPNLSNIFFGTIIQNDLTTFNQNIDNISKQDFSNDLSTQAYRNAQIANIKYSYLHKATLAFFIASIFWILTLGTTTFISKYTVTAKDPITEIVK